MNLRPLIATALTALSLYMAPGCAVQRGQESLGNYVDDTAITTSVKARYVESRAVDATSIRVETMHGVVLLSGFAKSSTEKSTAESIARQLKGVRSVKNELAVKP